VNGLEHEGLGSPTFRSVEERELSSKLEKVDLSDNLSSFQQRQEESGAGAVTASVKWCVGVSGSWSFTPSGLGVAFQCFGTSDFAKFWK
jgi:hypothetical protein